MADLQPKQWFEQSYGQSLQCWNYSCIWHADQITAIRSPVASSRRHSIVSCLAASGDVYNSVWSLENRKTAMCDVYLRYRPLRGRGTLPMCNSVTATVLVGVKVYRKFTWNIFLLVCDTLKSPLCIYWLGYCPKMTLLPAMGSLIYTHSAYCPYNQC